MGALQIAIVGGGFVGALAAYRLAHLGHKVHIFEAQPRTGQGCSARSFGWINSIHGDPIGDPKGYRRKLDAFEAFETLNQTLPGPLLDTRRGSIYWLDDTEEAEALAALHQAHGGPAELIDGEQFAKQVPHLANYPACAIYSPLDCWLNVSNGTELIFKAACAFGAQLHLDNYVTAVAADDGRARGVMLADGTYFEADAVVLAAGLSCRALLSPFNSGDQIEGSPVTQICFSANGPMLAHIIKDATRGTGFELRSTAPGQYMMVSGPPKTADKDGLQALGMEEIGLAVAAVPTISEPKLTSCGIGNRPCTSDGQPLEGAIEGVPGLFAAVGHPGIIYAPSMIDAVCTAIAEM